MNKDLRINRIYNFDELSTMVQDDFLIQFEDDLEFNKNDYLFCLRKISYKKLLEDYDIILGPNLVDEINDEYTTNLAMDIKTNGLKNPPIGSEGAHRCLAHLYLQEDLLWFEIIKKKLKGKKINFRGFMKKISDWL